MQKKYSDGFQILSPEPPVCLILQFKPSDPDFPFDLDSLQLQLSIPENYPSEPCSIEIRNQEFPSDIKLNIEQSWNKRASTAYKNKPMLLGLLKWLDNNLEKLLINEDRNEFFKLAQKGIQIIVNKKEEDSVPKEPQEKKEEGWISYILQKQQNILSELPKNKPDPEMNEEQEIYPSNEQQSINTYATVTAHKGTQIQAIGLQFQGMGIIECKKLVMVINCLRCKEQIQIELSPQETYAVECIKCHDPHIVSFRPDKMHETSAVVGYLDISGCIPFDFLESRFEGSCFECSSGIVFKKVPFTGAEQVKNCLSCHTKVLLSIQRLETIKIRAVRAPPPEIIVKKAKQKKDPNMAGIKVGSPLPKEGTCKHYSKSHRWFRFPCCGRAFPCDVCHEEQNQDNHEMLWATRQICGFCAREQTISNKACICGVNFENSRSSHWEGGKGCRNPVLMNRGDNQKYRNQNKTTSNKAKYSS